MFEGRHEIHADAIDSGKAVECYSIEAQKQHLVHADVLDATRTALDLATGWLPAAAEVYNISANICDYVLVPVVIMPSELPNRNQIGFPYEELTKFNVEAGDISYRTWRKRGCHYEHQNKVPHKALGVIFDTAFRPIAGTDGKVWKVINLCGFDRNKSPKICNQILSGDASYSMGAFAEGYQASCCGHEYAPNNECEHLKLGKPKFKIVDGKLAYYRALGVTGFETSFVQHGAYVSATSTKDRVISLF